MSKKFFERKIKKLSVIARTLVQPYHLTLKNSRVDIGRARALRRTIRVIIFKNKIHKKRKSALAIFQTLFHVTLSQKTLSSGIIAKTRQCLET